MGKPKKEMAANINNFHEPNFSVRFRRVFIICRVRLYRMLQTRNEFRLAEKHQNRRRSRVSI